MRQICVGIRDEVARARRGALSAMLGGDRARPAPAGGAGDLLRAAFTDEARIGPSYRGSGVIYLQPSMDGYHVIEVAQGQRWILEPGACWASSGAAARPRAPMLPSLRAGDGLLSCRSTLSGAGGDRRAGPAEVDGSATRCRAGWFSGCAAGLTSRAAPQPDLWAAAPAGLYRQRGAARLPCAQLERKALFPGFRAQRGLIAGTCWGFRPFPGCPGRGSRCRRTCRCPSPRAAVWR